MDTWSWAHKSIPWDQPLFLSTFLRNPRLSQVNEPKWRGDHFETPRISKWSADINGVPWDRTTSIRHSFVSRGRTRPSVRSQDGTAVHFPSGAKNFAIALPKNNHFVRETHAPRGYYVVLDDSSKSGNSPLRDLEVERHHFENLSFRYIRKVERS